MTSSRSIGILRIGHFSIRPVLVIALFVTLMLGGCSSGGDEPSPSGASFAVDRQLENQDVVQRLSQAGFSPRAEGSKSVFGYGDRSAISFSVGRNPAPNDTFVEVHEFIDPVAASANVKKISEYLDVFDTSSSAISRTYAVGNLVVHIRSYKGGGNGTDIKEIVEAVAGS